MDNNNIAGVATTNSSDNNDNKTGIITNSNNTQAANMTPPTASTISIADLANIMKSQGLSQVNLTFNFFQFSSNFYC